MQAVSCRVLLLKIAPTLSGITVHMRIRKLIRKRISGTLAWHSLAQEAVTPRRSAGGRARCRTADVLSGGAVVHLRLETGSGNS